MKIYKIIFALPFVLLLAGCQREQFKGAHLEESEKEVLKDKTVSYHAKVSRKVIEENEKNKNKNAKFRQKRREAQDKYLADLNSKDKAKKCKRKNCVAFNGF